MKKTMIIFTFLFTVMSLVITVYSLFSCFHQKNNNVIRLIFLKNKHFIAVLYIFFSNFTTSKLLIGYFIDRMLSKLPL